MRFSLGTKLGSWLSINWRDGLWVLLLPALAGCDPGFGLWTTIAAADNAHLSDACVLPALRSSGMRPDPLENSQFIVRDENSKQDSVNPANHLFILSLRSEERRVGK